MLNKATLRTAFGYPFTSKKKVMEALAVKDYASVNPYFYGIAKLGERYFTDDVIDKMMDAVIYTDELTERK